MKLLNFEMSEHAVRLMFFCGIFLVCAFWEIVASRKQLTASKSKRWVANLLLVVIDNLLVKVVLPIGAAGYALWLQSKQIGLFPMLGIDASQLVFVVITIAYMDLIIYWQHVAFHKIPILWKLHRVHHADTNLDVSSALRFHPIEILISMGIKLSAITFIGAAPIAVLVFEILLNGTAMFNHANIKLPKPIDAFVRLFLVTPDFHRVHHSVYSTETNSNYGFNLPWWDRLFKTYIPQPKDGHENMTIGLEYFRGEKYQRVDQLIAMPFYRENKD